MKIGDRIPDVSVKQMTANGPTDVNMAEYCAGRKVVIFALPGAFTPTCSESHLPGYVTNADAIKAKGIDAIACLAVSDFFVMDAWGKTQNAADKVDMLADGNGTFTDAVGMSIDLSEFGLGTRSKRYAMLIDDGVVQSLDIEESPGEAVVSGADAMLERLS